MSKIKTNKTKKYSKTIHKLHWTHFAAVIVLGGYFLISKINLAQAFSRQNPFIAFMQLFVFGILFTFLFLYLFSHEKFFPFAKEIEAKEKQKEKQYLKKYIHHGKVLGTFIIGLVGGPVFLSLTTRLLLNSFRFKYMVILVTSFLSSLITFGLGMGMFSVFN